MIKKSAIIISILTATLLAESIVELEPVSVTATGVEESVLEQPLSISTKGEEEVKLDQVIFQKDLLNSLAGVRVEQTGSVIGHTTAIRMPRSTSSYYLFLQDGIPVQSSGFFNHNGLAYTTFQTATSVEVLKGAGTALYGSDAVAATVNVKSLTKPSKEKEVIVKGMGGSYGYVSGSVEVSDTVDENNAYRANVSYMRGDGWREHTQTDRLEANIRLDHKIDIDNYLKIIINASKTDAEQANSFNDSDRDVAYNYISSGSTDAASESDSKYWKARDNMDVRRKFDYARISAELTNYSIDDLEISLTPYMRYNRNRYVATWLSNAPSNDNKLYTVGLLEKNTYDASWGRLITGFDTEYTHSTLEYNQEFADGAYIVEPLYDYDVDYFAIAPYIHTEYDITNELMLSAGLRYDYNRYDYDNNLDDNSFDNSGKYFRPADTTDSFDHLSPKLALSYKTTEDMNIYMRYANGFRIPQASRLYSMSKDQETVTLDPETSDTYEIGLKKYFDKKSFIEIAAYYMTIDDTITKYENPVTNDDYYDNGGRTKHKGIEITTLSQFTDDWAARVAYSFSKHKYDNNEKYGDNEMKQAPRNMANIRIINTPSYVKGLTLMGEMQYVGSWYMNDDNDKYGKYEGYKVFNLKADYIYNKKIRFFAKVTNLTDREYAVSAYHYYSYRFTPGDPRQFYAGLEYRW